MKKLLFFVWFLVVLVGFLPAQSIQLQPATASPGFFYPCHVQLESSVTGLPSMEPSYLRVQNLTSGWRKLKLGNNPNTIYGPPVNVTAGGNHTLEIVMKDLGGDCNWSTLRIRPMAVGELTLAPYVNAAGGVGSEWKRITIPLSDFSADIDFSALTYFEFPYAAGATPFDIAVSEIKFTGGAVPFLYFGQGKTGNIHDGTGTGPSLLAQVVAGVQPPEYVTVVNFYNGATLIGSDASAPYSLSWNPPSTGLYTISATMNTNLGAVYVSNNIDFLVEQPAPTALGVSLTQPAGGALFQSPALVNLVAQTSGLSPAETDYLEVISDGGGYRKLKLGYSNFSVYGPAVNVVASGNTMLEITLRDFTGNIDWSRILIKPSGLGSVSLQSYVAAAGGSNGDWFTISIPLSAFPSDVAFNNIANFEFPYSANAGAFRLGIRSMRMVGGTSPFLWFGDEKTDNKHDGSTSPYGMQASVIEATTSGDYVEKVEFWLGSTLLETDFSYPFTHSWVVEPTGDYTVLAKAYGHLGSQAYSDLVSFSVTQPATPASSLVAAITSPESQALHYSPLNLEVKASVSGIVLPGADYLKVVNNLTGYRKLKMGYGNQGVYGVLQNVMSGGNDTLLIELKDIGMTAAWDRIRIRPNAAGSLNLSSYVANAKPLENGWMAVRIPLSHFDAACNLQALQLFEFPYSTGAPFFELGVRLMKFTGGSAPFVWFGEGKTDNAHDGGSAGSQLQATLVNGMAGIVTPASIELSDNGVPIATDDAAPWELLYVNVPLGNRKLTVKVFDSNGLNSVSDTCYVTVEEFQPGNALVLQVRFDQPPTSVSVRKAPLLYNKDFAWSFTLDDTYKCAFNRAFPLLSGGYSTATGATYPGFFYTDGCGNDISFAGGLSWYSVNSLGNDIHLTSWSYINYSELPPMIDAGWRVFNHSYSHSAYAGTNYEYEVAANDAALRNNAGYRANMFVVPSGDVAYLPVAFAHGLLACFGNNVTYQGYPNGLDVDQAINTNQFKMYKRFLQDPDYDSTTILQQINTVASLSSGTNHLWYNDFTHRVTGGVGNLSFGLLKHYMETVAQSYGKEGSDRIWMAPLQTVYEYLLVRDQAILNYNLQGDVMQIAIDRTGVPDSLLDYALSLLIDADANITEITANQSVAMTYQTTHPEKLVNLRWTDGNLKRANETADGQSRLIAGNAFTLLPNPASEEVTARLSGYEGTATMSITATDGRLLSRTVLQFTGGEAVYPLDRSQLVSGLYLVTVTTDDHRVYQQKLMIR